MDIWRTLQYGGMRLGLVAFAVAAVLLSDGACLTSRAEVIEGAHETAQLEEVVADYRDALKERSRERGPLDWAATQIRLGNALLDLGERESGTARLEQAVAAYRDALKEYTRERVPLDWAATQHKLGIALSTLGERESATAQLEELRLLRTPVPSDWAATHDDFGNALRVIGESGTARPEEALRLIESGTARLEEAVTAYRDALKEYTREREPVQWAASLGSQGVAMILLAGRTRNATMAETAYQQIEVALETVRSSGSAPDTAYYESRLHWARRIRDHLKVP